MIDAREVGADVDLDVPGMAADGGLRMLHGRERPLAGPAGEAGRHHRPLQHRPGLGHHRMVQHAVGEAGGMDDAALGLEHHEPAVQPRGRPAGEDGLGQVRQVGVEIGEEGARIGPEVLPARRPHRRLCQVVESRDAVEVNPDSLHRRCPQAVRRPPLAARRAGYREMRRRTSPPWPCRPRRSRPGRRRRWPAAAPWPRAARW